MLYIFLISMKIVVFFQYKLVVRVTDAAGAPTGQIMYLNGQDMESIKALATTVEEVTHTGLPGPTTDLPDGSPCTVTQTVIELPQSVTQSFQAMVSSAKSQIQINQTIIQNGLTTNQVCLFKCVFRK